MHHDGKTKSLIQRALDEASADDVRFVHLDPALLFRATEGRIITPQQTAQIYEQLVSLDVGVVKQSGCVRDWWFCSRWRTGQRLVNHLSAGVPVVVWADAQGHLDAVEGRWPPQTRSGGTCCGSAKLQYPAELVVHSETQAKEALVALVQNASLRNLACVQGLRIAARFSLPRVAAHLAHILRWLVRKHSARVPLRATAMRSWRRPMHDGVRA